MKNKTSTEKLVRPLIIFAYLVLGVVGFRFFMDNVLKWVSPFIIGFILSRFVMPLRRRLGKNKKKQGAVSVLCTIIVLLCFFALIALMCYVIYRQLLPFFGNLSDQYDKLILYISEGDGKFDALFAGLPAAVGDALKKAVTEMPSKIDFVSVLLKPAIAVASSLPLVLLTIVATVVSTFFFVIYNEAVTGFMKKLIPASFYEKMDRMYRHLFRSMFKWLKAQCILCSVCFAELFAGFLILGFRYSLTLALLIAFIDFLPVLGAGAILIPWALIALLLGYYKTAAGVAIIYIVVLVVRNMLEPNVVGQQIGMHPLVTLMSIYVGFRMYGFLGMFVLPLVILTVIRLNEWGYIRLWPSSAVEKEDSPQEEQQ